MEEIFVLLKERLNQSKYAMTQQLGRLDLVTLILFMAGIAQCESVVSVWRRMRVKSLLPAPQRLHL